MDTGGSFILICSAMVCLITGPGFLWWARRKNVINTMMMSVLPLVIASLCDCCWLPAFSLAVCGEYLAVLQSPF